MIKEFAQPQLWDSIDSLATMAGLESSGLPIAAERRIERGQSFSYDLLRSYPKKIGKYGKDEDYF
jgi:hypothetical protein